MCGGDVVKTGKGYKCIHNTGASDACGLFIYSIIGNKIMTDDEISELLVKKEILIDGFASKDGKAFSTVLSLNPNGQVDMNSTVAVCPNCGGDIKVNMRAFGCSNFHHPDKPCKFTAWRNIAGHKLTLAEIREICEIGSTSTALTFFTEDGTAYEKKLSLSQDKLTLVKS